MQYVNILREYNPENLAKVTIFLSNQATGSVEATINKWAHKRLNFK